MERETRHRRWAETALTQELAAIGELESDLNIRQRNSPYWQSLFRIAGLVNAGHMSADEALMQIKFACRHMTLRGKDIDYQWGRALRRAKPRWPM